MLIVNKKIIIMLIVNKKIMLIVNEIIFLCYFNIVI